MKKLIYSQEDVDLMNCLEADEYKQALLDIKKYIELKGNLALYDKQKLLDIVNKAIGEDK